MSLGGKKIVKLPVGYVNNGSVLDEVELHAMTGVEEDILSDSKIPMSRRLNDIILNCLDRIGKETDKSKINEMIPKLSTDDQTAMLIALRSISVSNIYSYGIECPHCETPITINLDLDTLKISPGKAKETPVVDVKLPSGRTAKIRPMLIEDTEKTDQLRAENDAGLSASIWVRILELDGNQNPSFEDIKHMLYADRLYLREQFDVLEGGVENDLRVQCEKCKKVFSSLLSIARIEFFSPSMS